MGKKGQREREWEDEKTAVEERPEEPEYFMTLSYYSMIHKSLSLPFK